MTAKRRTTARRKKLRESREHLKRIRERQYEIFKKQKAINPRDVSILGGDPSL